MRIEHSNNLTQNSFSRNAVDHQLGDLVIMFPHPDFATKYTLSKRTSIIVSKPYGHTLLVSYGEKVHINIYNIK
jgi:hypothetical protein